MSNPFDQFSSDFTAALPPVAPMAPYGSQPGSQPNPIMISHQPPYGQQHENPYGAPPAPPMESNPYGAPISSDTSAHNPYGAPPSAAYQQPAPTANPFGGDGAATYGAPPPAPPPMYQPAPMSQQPPPPQTPERYGAPTPYAAAPASPMGQSVPTSVYMNTNPEVAPSAVSYTDPWSSAADHQPPAPTIPALNHDSSTMPSSMQQPPNPFGVPPPPSNSQYGAPPPSYPHASAESYGAPDQTTAYGMHPAPEQNPYAASQQQPPPPLPAASDHSMYGAYGAPPPPPAMEQPNPYGAAQPPAPHSEPTPYGASLPDQSAANPYGAPLEQQPPNPFAMPPVVPSGADQYALVPAQQPSNPYAAYGQPPPPPAAYGQPPPPYGQMTPYGQQPPPPYGYGVPQPPPPAPIDPFSVFESQSPPPSDPFPVAPTPVEVSANPSPATGGDDDFWGGFGGNVNSNAADTAAAPAPVAEKEPVGTSERKVEEEKKGDEGLPPGGEWYDARIFTPTLGVMFFKPQELTDSLFLNTDKDLVDALAERPVVAFIVEGSSARSAGVELGHVLLKVNGIDVRSPKEASRLIKEGPRPLPLLFYVPSTEVVVAEGEHMVKYDTKETTAPNSAKDWKPKYVVIGGIIAQPWMMNMYRSKSEYDIAVIETQARRPVSVKVKQFSLQGARIQNDWQGPQMVKYKNKLHPWKFICVLPVARNPIKISSPNLSQLKPVHEGIRRVLLAQQRGTVARSRSAGHHQTESYGGDRGVQSERRESQGTSQHYDSPSRQSHSGGDTYGHSPVRQPQQQQAYGY